MRMQLRRSNYDFNLLYNATPSSKIDDPNNESCISQPKRKRHRSIIWFNLPCSKNVVTNIGKTFLQLIDKHFPKSSRLHKIFNRNSIKISYSCMKNVKAIISTPTRELDRLNPPQPKKSTVTAARKMNVPSRKNVRPRLSCIKPS